MMATTTMMATTMALSVSDAWALAGIALMVMAVLARLAPVRSALGRLPIPVRLALAAAVLASALWPMAGFGADGLTWAAQLRGLVGDFSATSMLVAVLALAAPGRTSVGDRQALALASLVAGTLLIGLQLGSDRLDLYRLGYSGWGLPIGAATLALIAAWQGWTRTVLALTTALAAWGFGIPESSNLWDALLDPWWVLWCAGALLVRAWRGRRRADRLGRA
jgi:hypothetical protein